VNDAPTTNGAALRLHVALVHHPVEDRQGRQTASAVTNLDVHDLGRLARTYGLAGGWIVSPQPGQQAFVRRMIDHWNTEAANVLRPHRREALALIHVVPAIADMADQIKAAANGEPPLLVVTSARRCENSLDFPQLTGMINSRKRDIIVLFGTGWGLARPVFEAADHCLVPVAGRTGYNHLSVRSAMSIVIDRLVGDQRATSGQ